MIDEDKLYKYVCDARDKLDKDIQEKESQYNVVINMARSAKTNEDITRLQEEGSIYKTMMKDTSAMYEKFKADDVFLRYYETKYPSDKIESCKRNPF